MAKFYEIIANFITLLLKSAFNVADFLINSGLKILTFFLAWVLKLWWLFLIIFIYWFIRRLRED